MGTAAVSGSLSPRRVLLLAAALSLWWPARSQRLPAAASHHPGRAGDHVCAAVLVVVAILRASLSLSRHRFGLVWTLGVPVLLAGLVPLVPDGPVARPALMGLWVLVGLWVYHRWWPVGLQLEPPGLHRARFAGYRDVVG